MTIANIDNHHKIFNTILWQYEKAPRIVKFVSELSDLGYVMCGKMFDSVMNGILGALNGSDAFPMDVVRSLMCCVGFDWSSVEDLNKTIRCISATKFIGYSTASEMNAISEAFGFTYLVDQLDDGGRVVVLSTYPSANTLQNMSSSGISIPLSANQKYTGGISPGFTFSDSSLYVEDEAPRLVTDMELSYIGYECSTWNIEDVANGDIWE